MSLNGGCLCGRVRYEVSGAPFYTTACHCADCRRAAAAPYVAWFSVMRAAFRFVSGAPRDYVSSPGVVRSFCADCGTPLTYRNAALPDEIDVATASLDRPDDVPPERHTWVSQKLAWVVIADGLPQLPREGSG